MKTVNEVSRLTGVSVRTLHHYDAIGLLKPAAVTEAGYRLYDDAALLRLQQILLFRELEFPLQEIKGILESPNFDRNRALEQQITLLTLKKEHMENLIDLARGIQLIGVNKMDFTAFDTSKIDAYAAEAKASYGQTAEYQEFLQKSQGRTKEDDQRLSVQMMAIFTEFGGMRGYSPASEQVQAQVKKLRDFIDAHFYSCSDAMLLGLGRMYAGGGRLTEGIDEVGGEGTAEFIYQAIEICCQKQ
ncbi:MAG: MerR family transcriptional regulator [Oscillospiraceae bacterium]|nr:MerR family transcriptional regulator [Oscillospiraceae bacterium]